jgi:iron-sulfur cluster repair protein YtfE (RIC family)
MGIATSVKKATRQFEQAITGEEPEVDILDTLKEEHEEVAALLQKLVDGKSTAERKSLLKKIKASLVPHVRAEEKVLYNAILEVKDKAANQDGEEGYMEHGLADKMLATLGKITNAMSPEFGAAAKVLKELVEHHVKEEENAVWSDAKTHFSSEERKQMNQKYLRLKPTIRIP